MQKSGVFAYVALALCVMSAHAGTLYKCKVGSQVIYQDSICADGTVQTVKPPPRVDAAEVRAAESRLLKDRQALEWAENEKRLAQSRGRLIDAQNNLARTIEAQRQQNNQMDIGLRESRCKNLEVITIRAEKQALSAHNYETSRIAQARRAEYMSLCP